MTLNLGTRTTQTWIKRFAFLGFSAFSGALALFLIWQIDPNLDSWQSRLSSAINYSGAHPWLLMLAVATLPGIGFPLSPLLIFFGIALTPVWFTSHLYNGNLRPIHMHDLDIPAHIKPLKRQTTENYKQTPKNPESEKDSMIDLCLILRITPGIPYPLQNVVLGLLGMRLIPYLVTSLPITSIWTVAFIATGGAIFEGRTGLLISVAF